MEGLPSNDSEKKIISWDKGSYEEKMAAFNGLEIGDVLVSGSGTRRKLLGKADNAYTFEKTSTDGEITVESLLEGKVYNGFTGAFVHLEKGNEEDKKNPEEAISILRGLKEGNILHSQSGTYRVFLGRDGNVYTFERFGADGQKTVQSMSEEKLAANFDNIKSIDR